jgi:hypothetical protein
MTMALIAFVILQKTVTCYTSSSLQSLWNFDDANAQGTADANAALDVDLPCCSKSSHIDASTETVTDVQQQ